MLHHEQAFAIAKMRREELEADAAVRREFKRFDQDATKVETKVEEPKRRLFVRLRPA